MPVVLADGSALTDEHSDWRMDQRERADQYRGVRLTRWRMAIRQRTNESVHRRPERPDRTSIMAFAWLSVSDAT